MKVKLSKFDPIDYLKSEADIKGFLQSANETGDVEYIIKALAVAAKAHGLLQTSKTTGLNRSGIYHSFFGKNKNPGITTVAKVADSLGYQLTLIPKNAICK
jgi:probable addiction module antidote protein